MTSDGKPHIITPAEHLGFEVGDDRKLAGWPEIVEYFQKLGASSDRVETREIGKSTEGNPFIVATITSPENMADLNRFQAIQSRLADPRTIANQREADELISAGKVVVMITCSIHATEVGAAQMSMKLAHHMATSDTEETRRILDNVIFLLVPCLNPDGLIMVKQWYDETVGTEHEGIIPPFLYHKYVGHDNNRDWFMFTQAENRLTVEHLHNYWHPQIVYDMHQTRSTGTRLILPPFIDPIDSNVDPILQSELAMLGSAMAAELTAQGKPGVAINVVYDGYSPSRSYQHYHGGIRILSEAASARLASPVELSRGDLTSARGADPTRQSWNHPMPWGGGKWGLGDIVEYNFAAALACLGQAARYRDVWLRNFYLVGSRAIEDKRAPHAFLVPLAQRDPITANEMLRVLRTAEVEVHEATEDFEADGSTYPAGTRIVPLAQPYGAFAKTMLEVQRYPDLREYEGGPPKHPYDNTAHSLPIQMGVQTVQVREPIRVATKPVEDPRPPDGGVVRGPTDAARAYMVAAESNASIRAVLRLLKEGLRVSRLVNEATIEGRRYATGTFMVEGGPTAPEIVQDVMAESHLTADALGSPPSGPLSQLRMPRVGLYKSYSPTAEEGWTRFIFDGYDMPYTTVYDSDIRAGKLWERFDAILIPHQPPWLVHYGQYAGKYPAAYSGGLGARGADSLHEFAERGGTVVGWDGGALYAMRYLDLPVRNVLAELSEKDFFVPGALLRVILDTNHPLAYGMPSRSAVMSVGSPAFEVLRGTAVGSYPLHNPRLSGWILGAEKLHGTAALVEVPVGLGRVVLIGFRVHFRAQTRGTYRILFNSILSSVANR